MAGRYVVNMDISMPSAAVRIIRVTSDSNDIIVRANIEATGLGSVAAVRFEGDWPTGQIESIEEIHYDAPISGSPASINPVILLHPTAGTGRVGGDSSGCEIQFHLLSIERCRELTADLVRVPGGDPGNITLIDVSGNVTSDLIEGDTISEINVTGNIGAVGDPVRIDADTDLESLRTTNLYGDLNIDGNIEEIYVYGSSSQGTLEATDAVFAGTLDCDTMNLGAGLRIWGDLDATVTIDDEMTGATDPASNITRIAIGDDLNGDITIGSGGMNRGITIGWMESATAVWSGNVTVAGQTLAPKPDYTDDVEGGGAVGRVPYGAHFFECDPAYTVSGPGEVTVPGASTTANITITHYGYVKYSGSGKPYVVYESPGSHCTSGCSAELFSNKTSEWSTTSIGATASLRSMKLQGTARDGKHYHIDVNGTLECRDVFGEPSTAKTKPYSYIFNTN
ncbi:MAG: hypothetical protein RIB58_09160 [Phycisphaerales bacterium]